MPFWFKRAAKLALYFYIAQAVVGAIVGITIGTCIGLELNGVASCPIDLMQ